MRLIQAISPDIEKALIQPEIKPKRSLLVRRVGSYDNLMIITMNLNSCPP